MRPPPNVCGGVTTLVDGFENGLPYGHDANGEKLAL